MRLMAAGILFLLFSTCYAPAQNSQQPAKPTAPASSEDAAAPAKIDPAKDADIRHLMDLTGVGALATQSMASMEANIRPLMTQAFPPGEYRAQLIELFFEKFHSKAGAKQILDLAVPIYDKYYTHEEIKQLIQFYGTPVGQKTITILPKLMAELRTAGSSFGEELGRQSMTEVLAEHPELEKAMEDAKAAAQPK